MELSFSFSINNKSEYLDFLEGLISDEQKKCASKVRHEIGQKQRFSSNDEMLGWLKEQRTEAFEYWKNERAELGVLGVISDINGILPDDAAFDGLRDRPYRVAMLLLADMVQSKIMENGFCVKLSNIDWGKIAAQTKDVFSGFSSVSDGWEWAQYVERFKELIWHFEALNIYDLDIKLIEVNEAQQHESNIILNPSFARSISNQADYIAFVEYLIRERQKQDAKHEERKIETKRNNASNDEMLGWLKQCRATELEERERMEMAKVFRIDTMGDEAPTYAANHLATFIIIEEEKLNPSPPDQQSNGFYSQAASKRVDWGKVSTNTLLVYNGLGDKVRDWIHSQMVKDFRNIFLHSQRIRVFTRHIQEYEIVDNKVMLLEAEQTQKGENPYLDAIQILKGCNVHGRKIMKDADFEYLLEKVTEMLEKDTLPNINRQIPQIDFPTGHLIYLFYSIHLGKFGKREIRRYFFDFLLNVFQQFSSYKKDTIRKKFSQKPSTWDADLNFISGNK